MTLKNKILWFFRPIQKFFQNLGRRETLMTDAAVKFVMEIVQPGDIILSYEMQRSTSMFIRGSFKHASIVTSEKSIMEAVGDEYKDGKNIGGVREVSLMSWLYKKDHVAVIRPVYPFSTINKIAGANAYAYKGLNYDYSFSFAKDKLYCSELVYQCYISEDPTFMDHVPDEREVLPIDYLNMCIRNPLRMNCLYNTMSVY